MSVRAGLAGAAVVAGALLLLLPVAELVVRVVRPQLLPSQESLRDIVLRGMYMEDPEAGYRLAPDFSGRYERKGIATEFRTNALGLRGPEPGTKTGPRVLAVGDSYTFGWGVGEGETWVHVVADELSSGGTRVQPLNAGVNGYGTVGALAQLRRVGPVVQPDLVLHGFYANDFTDNLLGPEIFEIRDGLLFDRFTHEFYEEGFLARHSHLYRLVALAFETARLRLGGVPRPRAVRDVGAEDFELGADIAFDAILAMRDLADSLGAAFAVVWLPADVYALNRSRPEDIPLLHGLQGRVAAAGVSGLDLLPVATAESRRSGLYHLPADGHLSVRGNRVVGRAVAAWIREQGFLD